MSETMEMTKPTVGPESAPVPLWEVESEISSRLNAMRGSNGTIVMQARMSNLVIFCSDSDDLERINDTIPDIMSGHPARVLLLFAQNEGAASVLTATVNICAHTERDNQKLCSEQITLRAVGTSVKKLPFVVRGLLVGDLPTNLWWATKQPPPFGGELFHELSESVEQVVFDSIGWAEPAKGLLAVSNWVARLEQVSRPLHWRLGADLNWRRLKFWRRIVAQALDPNTAPGFLDVIKEVYLEHGPHGVIPAWMVISWLASRLGWQVRMGRVQPNLEMAWQCQTPSGKQVSLRIRRLEEGDPEIHRVRIAGDSESFDFVSEGRLRLSVVPEGMDAAARTVAVSAVPMAELVSRELSDRDRDPIYRETLQFAQAMAQSVNR